MTAQRPNFSSMSSEELIALASKTVGDERQSLVDSIWQLDELERRGQLAGCSSLWTFCSHVLRLSNGSCSTREVAVGLFRKFPVIADYLADGRVSFKKLLLLQDVLNKENVELLLNEASTLTEYDVKRLVARKLPLPAVPDTMRKRRSRTSPGEVDVLPSPSPTSSAPESPAAAAAASGQSQASATTASSSETAATHSAPLTSSVSTNRQDAAHALDLPLFTGVPQSRRSRDVMRPLNETDTEIGFTADDEFMAMFNQAKSLLSHKFPRRGHAEVLGECLRIALEVILKKKLGAGTKRAKQLAESPRADVTAVAPAVARASATSPGEVTTRASSSFHSPGSSTATQSQRPRDKDAHGTSPGEVAQASSTPFADEAEANFSSPGEVEESSLNDFADPPVPADLFDRPSRYVPTALRRRISERDRGCCSILLDDGTRCGSTYQLEIDHVEPYALGGPATEENLRLVCGPHNRRLAEKFFGSLGRST